MPGPRRGARGGRGRANGEDGALWWISLVLFCGGRTENGSDDRRRSLGWTGSYVVLRGGSADRAWRAAVDSPRSRIPSVESLTAQPLRRTHDRYVTPGHPCTGAGV